MRTRIVFGAAAIAVWSGLMIAQQDGGQPRPVAPYTAEQASAGRAAYQTSCAACHAPDLSGREGPQLSGPNFVRQWGDKTAGELINFMRLTMPPGAGGSLSDQTYADVAAFILDANGARSGNWTLTAESNVAIRDVASVQSAASLGQSTTDRSPAPQPIDQEGNQRRQAPRGITVPGEVKNYIPVTDAMLRNPDPGDWLMIRRDYKATYFSPLNQINAQNVNELSLAWSWAMQDGASNGNQPAPIVHNGVLHVNT